MTNKEEEETVEEKGEKNEEEEEDEEEEEEEEGEAVIEGKYHERNGKHMNFQSASIQKQ